jgi:hypothetical protein
VLLLRHPLAVAVSKRQKRHWFWVQEPLDLLNQPDLFHDYLRPHEETIRRVSADGDDIARHVLIWSIVNYVPLLQFRPDQLHVVFYEDVCARPAEEVSAVMRHVGGGDDGRAVRIDDRLVAKPSRVTDRASAVRQGGSPVDAWRRALTTAQIDSAIAILAEFGLDAMYSADPMPQRAGLHRFREAAS